MFSATTTQLLGHAKSQPAQSKCLLRLMLKASICHKSKLEDNNAKRWPYETKQWGYRNFFLDPFTKKKFNENTKIILVEGNVGVGKNDFAKRLADELGMLYMPRIDLTGYYTNNYGFDYRALNPLLPERLRVCDWDMFHENPSRHSVISMQVYLFKLRTYQYIKALQHIFNTGQGVVMARSAFTERVFVEAMHELGWLPRGYLRGDGFRFYDYKIFYNYLRGLSVNLLNKPHLTIYLETPIETCMKRIKESPDPMIANSNALIPEFLEQIHEAYENVILPKLDHNGHVLRVPYENRATQEEILDVVDDIEKFDFTFDERDTRFADWNDELHGLWYFHQRRAWTNLRLCTQPLSFIAISNFDIAGFGDSITQIDLILRQNIYDNYTRGVGNLDRKFNTNFKITKKFWKAFFDYGNFGERMEDHLRSDFV